MSQQDPHAPCDVSVVISTRNRAHLLRPCLDALLRQCADGVRYEIIVVDNHSTDGTAAVVADVAGHESSVPVRALREPRPGVWHGRNAGIAAASGRIVAFTDDDIRAAPDWVQRIARAFESDPAIDCIGGPVRPLWAARPPRWLDRRHWSPLSVTDYGADAFDITADRPRCLLTSNIAFRRDVFDRIGVFSPAFPRSQDHELQVRFWSAGGRARYVPDLVVHTMVPESRMRTRYHRHWHVQHGRMCARMALRERTRPDGSLRQAPLAPRLIAGAPAFLWRELGVACGAWVRSWFSRDRATRLDREMRVRHLAGYVAERRLAASTAGEVSHGEERPERGRMTAARVALVHVLIALVTGGAAWDVVRDQEHWPFSQYPMFAPAERDWSHRTLRVFAVTPDHGEVAVLDTRLLHPFDQCRLSTALLRLRRDPRALDAALADTYRRLEGRVAEGAPAAAALRLYELRWTLVPGRANDEHPDARTMLAEYRPGTGARR